MPKPRIAVVSPFIDKRHGTERTVAECLQRLAGEYEIHIYSNRVEDVNLDTMTWHRVPHLPGPHLVSYLWWFSANHLWRWYDARFRGLVPEIVFSPGINCLDADVMQVHVVFGRFRERLKEQLLFRGNPVKAWARILHRRVYYSLIASLERTIYPQAQRPLVAVSRKTAKDLSGFYGRVSNVSIAYNGLDFERFNPATRAALRDDARRALGLSKNQIALLLIGNDWKSKGLPCVLNAVAHLSNPEIVIHVVGRDNSAPFQDTIRQHNLVERVRFLPPRADVEFYYSAADIYVSPTLEDAFALPPAEAMACGLPIITSIRNGGAEIVTPGQDGFVLGEPLDFIALADILQRLAGDSEERERIGEKAIATAAQLTWDNSAMQIREAWEQARNIKNVFSR